MSFSRRRDAAQILESSCSAYPTLSWRDYLVIPSALTAVGSPQKVVAIVSGRGETEMDEPALFL